MTTENSRLPGAAIPAQNKQKNKQIGGMKMTREKMIESLREVGSVRVNSKELEDIMPLVYEHLLEMLKGFAEESQAFQKGKYLIDIYFNDGIAYFVGKDAQQLANEPRWAYDDYNDIETEELQALLKAAKEVY